MTPFATDIPNPLLSAALARPEHPLCEAHGKSLDAAELLLAVRRQATRFASAGVSPEAGVVLTGSAGLDWVVAWHALGWLGAVVLPVAPSATKLELSHAYDVLQPRFAVCCGQTARSHHEALLRERGIAVLPLEAYAATSPAHDSPSDLAPERPWALAEPRVGLLTSGTSATPRAVRLTSLQLLFSAFGSAIRLGHVPDDRWLCCLPLWHVGGLSILYRCAFYGTTALIHDGFRAERVAQVLDAGDATLVSLVPTMLSRVLDARDHRPFPKTLRAVLLGGAPASAELLQRCEELQVPVALTWGMTEAASQIATGFPTEKRANSMCAPVLPFARVDAEGGMLHVYGPLVGGELRTRDRGYVDDVGWVHCTGREDDVINSGGEKIVPEEVEAVLEAHRAVAGAALVRVASQSWGERPVAVLVQQPDAERPTQQELALWCRARLSGFKVPARFVWRDSLPYGNMGKVSRWLLGAEVSPPVLED